uniref:Transmembrane protein 268 n=1 Tax=Varanus komodoensis TaxID=61221 RepID=A0A8D2LQY2_VARKO
MAEEEEAWPFSISYCWKKEEELSDLWRKELLNGQALLVLTLPQFCSSTPFDVNIWIERLKAMGIQMTVDQWKNLIQHAVLKPEVSKYLFYNSRALGITITVVLYVTLWLNLYSTLITFAAGKPWVVSIVVTLVSLVAALTIRLITLRYQSKMNVNTDMRLAAANEACMKHGFLVGFTVVPDKHRSVPQVSFQCGKTHSLPGSREKGCSRIPFSCVLNSMGTFLPFVPIAQCNTCVFQVSPTRQDKALRRQPSPSLSKLYL